MGVSMMENGLCASLPIEGHGEGICRHGQEASPSQKEAVLILNGLSLAATRQDRRPAVAQATGLFIFILRPVEAGSPADAGAPFQPR
jgi:hypothetical protein